IFDTLSFGKNYYDVILTEIFLLHLAHQSQTMILSEIDVVEDIDKDVFLKKYFKPQKPVLIKGLAKKWEAYSKWSLDYIAAQAGEQVVGLYDNKPADPNKPTDEPVTYMKMRE